MAKKVFCEKNKLTFRQIGIPLRILITGSTHSVSITYILEIIGKESTLLAGLYIVVTKKGPIFFADTTINKNPSEEDLFNITLLTVNAVKRFGIKPIISMLSYSNFGSSNISPVADHLRCVGSNPFLLSINSMCALGFKTIVSESL